jgi:signal transduction histidine kinase/ligand-binding sensor domain-containing protein
MLTGWILIPALFSASQARSDSGKAGCWRIYTAGEGFSDSSFRAITVAENGVILAVNSSSSGVCKFDGYDAMSVSLPAGATGHVYQSPAGQFWICWSGGLWTMKDGAWRRLDIPEISAAIRTNPESEIPLYPLRQNVVLCLLPERLIEIDAEPTRDVRLRTLRDNGQSRIGKFSALAVDGNDEMWIVGKDGLSRSAGPAHALNQASSWNDFVPPDSVRLRNFRKPEPDESGLVLVADAEGADGQVQVHFDGINWETRAFDVAGIQFAWRGPDGNGWAASSTALYKWRDGALAVVTNLSPRLYRDAGVDGRGTFWLATSEGLVRFTPTLWRSPESGALPNSTVRRIAEGGVLTDVAGDLIGFDSEMTPATIFPGARGEIHARPLGLLRDGRVCFETRVGGGARTSRRLETWDGTNFQPLPFAPPGTGINGDLLCLLETQTGDIWLGESVGIAWLHTRWTVFPGSDNTTPQGVRHLVELPDGRIWAASRDRIWSFDGRNWTMVRNGVSSITAMISTRDGSVWVGKKHGVMRFFRGNWIENGLEDGLDDDRVGALCEDERGGIWAIGTNALARFHPQADSDPPRTIIHPMAEREKNIPEDRAITVRFGGQDKWRVTRSARLMYSHKLDDGEWSPFAAGTGAMFSDLAPGKHYFQVRAMDRAGNVDPNPAHLEFSVVLPWYLEGRLVLIAGAGTAAAVFFASLAYKRHRQLVLSYAAVEKQVAERTRELGIANQELLQSEKMRALGTLAAGIAHDFNNILSIVKGSAQIIEDNLDDAKKICARTDRIKTVVDQGSSVVQALLGFSRDSMDMLEPCELNLVVDNTIKLLGDRFQRQVEVQFDRAADLPQVRASQSLIQQILLNFIFNASESMNGRKRIVIATSFPFPLSDGMALMPHPASTYVAVSVRDFGCGIVPENMSRVFEPFFTTKALSTRRGTGLGLSVVYELAKKMEAGLSLESTVGEGSVFSLVLPAISPGQVNPLAS